jgi:hypothetical protein
MQVTQVSVSASASEKGLSSCDDDDDADDGTTNKGETVSIPSTEVDEMDTNSSEVNNANSPAGLRPAV